MSVGSQKMSGCATVACVGFAAADEVGCGGWNGEEMCGVVGAGWWRWLLAMHLLVWKDKRKHALSDLDFFVQFGLLIKGAEQRVQIGAQIAYDG